MASFEGVDYSLRPSKNIQRQLVFEAMRLLQAALDLERLVYVGFGSIWFTDFVMAHKLLHIRDMRSIEADEVGYRRAVFNIPYSTVRVMSGFSSAVLPVLYADDFLRQRPWLLWLDYDKGLTEAVAGDVRSVIENAPTNTILIVTFNGKDMTYGHAHERAERLRSILGSVVPDELSKADCKESRMQETLANLTLDFMKSIAADLARPGGFVPAFRLIYEDTVPMVTVGGILPTKGAVSAAAETVAAPAWPAFPAAPIKAPHLTFREAISLQSQFPQDSPMTRERVRELGFDLEEDQIRAFQTYYRQYPSFAQIIG